MDVDLIITLVMIGVAVLAGVSFLLRVWLGGRIRYARVERQGGSVLLGKSLMSMTYWSLQPVAQLLVFLKIRPHVLSWMSLLLGFGAGTCLMVGRFGIGAIFAAVSALLDALDGMVARMAGVASNTGEILDTTVDRYCEFFYLAGLVLYYRNDPVLIIACLLAMVGSFMVSYTTAKAEALDVPLEPDRGIMRRPERAFYLILGAALTPLSISWWEAGAARPVGYPMVAALFLVAILSNVATAERMFAIVKKLKAKGADPVGAPDEANEPEVKTGSDVSGLEPEPA